MPQLLIYQSIIIISILIFFSLGKLLFNSYNLSKILGSIASAFWIYWTLVGSVHFGQGRVWPFSGLWFYQIIESIFLFIVCFAIINWLSKKDSQIEQSAKLLSELINAKDRIDNDALINHIKQNLEASKLESLSSLAQHRKIFFNTLGQATNSICILSGTTTNYVVNDDFKISIIECLKRGVNIYIGYGYKSKKYHQKPKEDYELEAEKSLKSLLLESTKENYKGKLFLAFYQNHSKMLICDDEYVVCGSFNWLSKAGGPNAERSFISYDKKLILKEAQDIKKFIIENAMKIKL